MKLLASLLILFTLCSCASTSNPRSDFSPTAISAIKKIEAVLPPDWKVVERGQNSVPRGIVNQEGGYYIKVRGPSPIYWTLRTNGVPTTKVYGKEEIQLWIMPPDYQPKKPGFIHAVTLCLIPTYVAAEAGNSRFKVFSEYSPTPSWPTWGEELYDALQVKPTNP